MKLITANLLIILAMLLLALAYRLKRKRTGPDRITARRRGQPGRLTITANLLAIVFNTVAYAAIGV